ncbi:hypothetical protein [Novosphingobium sp. AAP83]|uniref:hypothetical protein n=1 Tax=Novosphingobium sp. AAP83 TaxID=1523425 RepID=UPI001E4FD521|nr:hypothetical protein [Novosphingobium sp. AAP83]
MIPLVLERQAGETQLWVKEVRVGTGKTAQCYILTLNEAEAKKDKADRPAIIDGLQAQLKKGDKALVGNSAYWRYLKTSGKTSEIDLGTRTHVTGEVGNVFKAVGIALPASITEQAAA